MRVALISDIHGNLPALEAVLADLERRQVERIVVLGDLVVGGPSPREVLSRIRGRAHAVVRGNTDELVADDPARWEPADVEDEAGRRFKAQLRWVRQQLTAEDLAYLRGLPVVEEIPVGPVLLRAFHATPSDPWPAVLPFAEDDALAALFEGSDALIAAYGHIHRPYVRYLADRRCIVNPGPVGVPGPLASYALLEVGSSGFDVLLVHVAYDPEEVVALARQRGFPEAEAAIPNWRGPTAWPRRTAP